MTHYSSISSADKILANLPKNGALITTGNLQKMCHLDRTTFNKAITSLVKSNQVLIEGAGKNTKYKRNLAYEASNNGTS